MVMDKDKACILNYGCQMNEYETMTLRKMLLGAGFVMTDSPDDAGLVLLNTCTIRDSADVKIWNRLHSLQGQKRKNPRKLVGVLGCMVEAQRTELLKMDPAPDFILGPDELQNSAILLEEIIKRHFSDYESIEKTNEGNPLPFKSYLPVQRGCNFACSYCIVPSVKGRAFCFSPESILEKASGLVAGGVKEITLLGQTINSYRYEKTGFVDLLALVCRSFPQIWVRFLTSHPSLFQADILDLFAQYPNLCPLFHFPVQSGNDRVLKQMQRGYTRERYLNMVRQIRQRVPDVIISTDMICGFPSETEAEFADSLSIMEEAGFEMAFMFAYSERSGTPAAEMAEAVPETVRKERLARMIEEQMQRQGRLYNGLTDKKTQVLVESVSRRNENELKGRTAAGLPVIFPGDAGQIGSFVMVEIKSATSHTLRAEQIFTAGADLMPV
jgi:tRNA-2-methylthio-N6-dimethylallyladenosine synthase